MHGRRHLRLRIVVEPCAAAAAIVVDDASGVAVAQCSMNWWRKMLCWVRLPADQRWMSG